MKRESSTFSKENSNFAPASHFSGPAQQVFEWEKGGGGGGGGGGNSVPNMCACGGGGGGLERQKSKMDQLGGGGIRGHALPDNFDFIFSQMPKNAF